MKCFNSENDSKDKDQAGMEEELDELMDACGRKHSRNRHILMIVGACVVVLVFIVAFKSGTLLFGGKADEAKGRVKPPQAVSSMAQDDKSSADAGTASTQKDAKPDSKPATDAGSTGNDQTEKPKGNQPEKITYKEYKNARYGFSIAYPNYLVKRQEPDNGDGIILTNEDGSVRLVVSGINNVLNETPASACNDALKNIGKVSYKAQSGNWFVLSWVEGNKIVYAKYVVGPGSINTYVFEYPASKKDSYQEVMSKLNSSFKTPSIHQMH